MGDVFSAADFRPQPPQPAEELRVGPLTGCVEAVLRLASGLQNDAGNVDGWAVFAFKKYGLSLSWSADIRVVVGDEFRC